MHVVHPLAVMDTRNIMPSETDNKLAHFNNFLQLAACLCRQFDCEGADLITFAADLFFSTLMGCMSAQVAHELKAEASGKVVPPSQMAPPQSMVMERPGSVIAQPVTVSSPQVIVTTQAVAQPFMVAVPPGVNPGEVMMVQSPTTGQMLQVQVPPNIGPGGQFQVMG